MAVILVTGMSGAGKSTALAELARRGHRVVDTDEADWSEDVPLAHGGTERLWREDKMNALLAEHVVGTLFISGCVANQGLFLPSVQRGCAAQRPRRYAPGTCDYPYHEPLRKGPVGARRNCRQYGRCRASAARRSDCLRSTPGCRLMPWPMSWSAWPEQPDRFSPPVLQPQQ